jgi:hypothetical protein
MLRVKGDGPRTYVHLPAEFSERCVVFFARVEPRDGDELDRSPMYVSQPELSAGLVCGNRLLTRLEFSIPPK